MQIHSIPNEPTPPELVKPKITLHKIISKADRLLRLIADRDPRYNLLLHVPVDKLRKLTEPVRWGYECKVVRYHGQTFHFSDSQAEVIRILKRQRSKGTPRIRERSILSILQVDDELNSTKYRLISRFRVGKGYHPAINVMVMVEDGWWWVQ